VFLFVPLALLAKCERRGGGDWPDLLVGRRVWAAVKFGPSDRYGRTRCGKRFRTSDGIMLAVNLDDRGIFAACRRCERAREYTFGWGGDWAFSDFASLLALSAIAIPLG